MDLLIGDTPILDYYRANDPGCTLRTVDVIEEDNYAVGMTKGLQLQVRCLSLPYTNTADNIKRIKAILLIVVVTLGYLF